MIDKKTVKAFNEFDWSKKKRPTAERRIIVTDQGCGGEYCSNCLSTTYPSKDYCPSCGYFLVRGEVGGDFGNYDPNRL